MAKIKDAKPKQSSGGYSRIVGENKISEIAQKIQSTTISAGTELEKIIQEKSNLIFDLDDFIDGIQTKNGSYLCPKKILKKSKYALSGHEPDFLIFIIDEYNKKCTVLELKDGDAFDTKKSESEKETLILLRNHLEQLLTQFEIKVDYKICCFNQSDKEKIVEGFKKKFSISEVMSGNELCDLLGINYEAIKTQREADIKENIIYAVEELSTMNELKKKINDTQKNVVIEKEFYDE